jgi:hypothetical protein
MAAITPAKGFSRKRDIRFSPDFFRQKRHSNRQPSDLGTQRFKLWAGIPQRKCVRLASLGIGFSLVRTSAAPSQDYNERRFVGRGFAGKFTNMSGNQRWLCEFSHRRGVAARGVWWWLPRTVFTVDKLAAASEFGDIECQLNHPESGDLRK